MYKKIGLLCSIVMVVAFCVPAYGLEFSPPVIVNQGMGGSNVQATMDIDAQGNVYAAWVLDMYPGGMSKVYFSMSPDNGTTWTSPSIVADTTNVWFRSNPWLQVGSNGSIYITWTMWIYAGLPSVAPLMCSISDDTGATWSHYQVDDGEMGGKMYSSLIVDQNDNLYAIWHDERIFWENAHPYFAQSTDNGQTWLPVPNVRVDQGSHQFSHSYTRPRIVIDTSGILYAFFHLHGPTGWEVYFTKSTNGGFSWSPSISVAETQGYDDYPDIACDAEGNLYVVWYNDPNCIYFSKSTDGGFSWSDATPIVEGISWPMPSIALDANGNIYVVYGADRVYFTMSFDDGNTWTEPTYVNDTIGFASNQNQAPSLYVAPNGRISIAWSDGSNVYFTTAASPVIVSVPDTTYGAAGDTVTIPVNTDDLTGLGVVSAEFDLTYDSGILSGVDVDTSGTLLSGADWTWQFDAADDTIHVDMAGTDTLVGSGTLINLLFVVSPDAGIGEESPLHFEDFMFNQGEPSVITRDGVFIVRDIFGAIEGTVTDAASGSPIAGAMVTAYSTHPCCDTTNVTGHYFIPEVFPDTYNVTVAASGYNQCDTMGIVVLPGETTEVNFVLLHPEIVVVPGTFDVTLDVDSTLDTLLYITNNGNGPLEFNIEVVTDGLKTALHRATSDKGRIHSEPGPASFCRTPADWVPDLAASLDTGEIIEEHPSVGSPTGFEWDGTYFWQGNWDGNVVKLDSDFNLIAEYTACGNPDMPPTGLAWHNGFLYQACYLENNVYKIDVSDGYNPVDTINVPGDGGLLGVEWVGNHLWVTDDNTELIYECDSLGNTINSWTSPDLVPFGMSYNPYLDIIYLNGWAEGNIYSIDPHTGEINFVFPTPGSGGDHSCAGSSFDDRYPTYLWITHQSDWILYLIDTGNEWWISTTPTSGTVPAGETFEVTIHFDTYGLTLDSTYTTSILIHNNSTDSLVDIPVTLHTVTVGVEETASIPKVFALAQSYPNPFRERTVISYSLPGNAKGTIYDLRFTIYDLSGRAVKTLVDDTQKPGYYSVKWDGSDNNGRKLVSGIYFYRLEAGDYVKIKKLILMR